MSCAHNNYFIILSALPTHTASRYTIYRLTKLYQQLLAHIIFISVNISSYNLEWQK